MTYKEAIKKIKKKLIMAQMEFTGFAVASFATVNRWEQGEFLPTFQAKQKLALFSQKYQIEVDE